MFYVFQFCRIGVDLFLRVPSKPDVYAIGDCAGYLENTSRPVLPALAQVGIMSQYLKAWLYFHFFYNDLHDKIRKTCI
jgi:NADH dehydrogenase FAD-containing subunit